MGFWGTPPTPPTPPSPEKDPREAIADAELAELLSNLTTTTTTETPTTTTRPKSKPKVEGKEKVVETTFPTTMSCITAFDEMYYCYSLGGQFLNVYRYGELRSCSEKAADWRFCMRTRSYGPAARRAMISERFRQKAGRYKVGRSSEDVWEVRRGGEGEEGEGFGGFGGKVEEEGGVE